MILPSDRRPTDVPDFTEAVPPVFRSRRKADALPKLAPPERSNGFERPTKGLVLWPGLALAAGLLAFGYLLAAVLK